MAKVLSEKAIAILSYLRENSNEVLIADDIAITLEMTPRSANGTITALAKKGLVERQEIDNIKKKVIRLTPKGEVVNLDEEKE